MLALPKHAAAVRCLAYVPSGNALLSGDESGRLRFWDVQSGRERWSCTFENSCVEAIAVGMDDMAAGLSDGRLILLELSNGRVRSETLAHEGGVRGLVAVPTGHGWVSSGWDNAVKRWNPKAKRATVVGGMPAFGAAALALSADGQTLALGSARGGYATVGTATWKRRVAGDAPAPLYATACQPNGPIVAFGGAGEAILLVDRTDGRLVRELRGHTWTVYGLAFTADGRHLLSGGADRTTRLWHVETGREVLRAEWHAKWVTALAIAPDGMTAASASDDGGIVIWDLPET